MGMSLETFFGGTPPVERKAFRCGDQKINLHIKGSEFETKASFPNPGALDLCFIAIVPLEVVISNMRRCPWPIIEAMLSTHHAIGIGLRAAREAACARGQPKAKHASP